MAKSLFISLLKHYGWWLLLFAIGRAVFIVWNREEMTGIPTGEILFAFIKGLYVDTAMACYFLAPAFLFSAGILLTGKKWLVKTNYVFHIVLFTAFFLVTFGELSIYDEWHTKLSYKALWFFGNPAEVFHTASWAQLIFGFGFTFLCTAITAWIYKRKIAVAPVTGMRPDWKFLLTALAVIPLLLLGVRGGYQTIPVQLSDAYYSTHNVLNLASLNSPFNLASSCIENFDASEPYDFMTQADAGKTFTQLHAHSDSTQRVLTTARPNIVLVVLEGWSADVIGSFDGIEGITPNFDQLSSEGISFTKCYASGYLSDQGMAAVFSAFPAQPRTSIITQPDKYTHLPCVNKEMKEAGYHTSFMFGGQLSYGNIRSYMYFNGFDHIIEGKDFDQTLPEGKLGFHDQFLFSRQLTELHTETQPFFAAMFTLSTHGPYDFPMAKSISPNGKEEDYVNSVHYADSCIGDFIRRAKNEAWYANTLFVFVSDHSHNSPKNYDWFSPEFRRIPMLFYGNVIDSTWRGRKYEAVVSQTDLAATLLGQLQLDANEFKFSKNLFDPSVQHFAFYTFEEGFGFVNDAASVVWPAGGSIIYKQQPAAAGTSGSDSDSTALLHNGQAILQVLTHDYYQY